MQELIAELANLLSLMEKAVYGRNADVLQPSSSCVTHPHAEGGEDCQLARLLTRERRVGAQLAEGSLTIHKDRGT